MKKIFLFLVIFALSFGAKAQSWTPIFGKQRFASGLGIPTKDSTYFAGSADSSLIYINPKDAGLYYKYKGYHKKVGTGTVSSVGLTMPSAFSVSGSPITNNGSFIVTSAGSITQYIRGDGSLATLNTAAVPESGNLYYTDARARAAISGTSPISVTSGVVSISQSSGSTNGYLSATDWTVFNSKQTALNGTGFVKQSGTTTSYDNTTYYPASNPNGYTSNTGTVTSVALTAPSAFTVTGSPVTTSGTLALGAAGNSTQYIDGSGSLQTFPTMLSSDNLIKLVRNQSGATMTAGTIVYIDGATGNKPTIAKALATSDATSAQTYGAVQVDIANNADGYIVVIGNINNLNTNGLTEGAQLYLSSTTAGTYTTTKQYAPAHLVYVGIVLRAHPTQGIIGVKIQNGYELDELHNVAAQTPSNNDGLFYESLTSLWKNKSIATVLGYTPEQPLTFSAPLSRSVNTVSIPAATSSANGYLSSTDWTTFNGKQNAITLTTTGSSGSATFISNTLNVPTYTLAGLGGQPQLNGTGFVKASGTTISYDNSTYLTTSSASSTYVPYTGATQGVNIGTNMYTGGYAVLNGSGTNQAGVLSLFKGTSRAVQGNGYTNLYAEDGKVGFNDWITGNVRTFEFSLASLTSGTTRVYTLPDASGTIALTSGLTGFVSGSGTSGQVPLFNGTQSVTNSQIYDNGNTVSIGNSVTSPNKLVSFSTNASGFAILGSGSGGAGGVYAAVTSGTGNMFQGSTSNGGYFISDNAGNTYISGKVGIGTFSSSSYNLNVVGTGYFSNNLTASQLFAGSSTHGYLNLTAANTGGNEAGIFFAINGNKWEQYTAANDLSMNWYSYALSSVAMKINPSGNLSIGSNTDAGFKLDVNGTGRFSDRVTANGFSAIGTNSGFSIFRRDNNAYAGGWYSPSGSILLDLAGLGTAMTIATSTGAATFSSSVTATSLFVNAGTGSNLRVISGGTNILNVANYSVADGFREFLLAGSELSFYSGTAGAGSLSERMRITSSGNVGIGTTAPAGGISGTEVALEISNPNVGVLALTSLAASGRKYQIYSSNDGSLYFRDGTTGNQRFNIQYTGNVGIGTTAPTGQLSIKNQISNGANPTTSYAATNGVDGQNFFNGYYASNSDGAGTYPRYFDIVSIGSPDGTNGSSNIRFFTNGIANNSAAIERVRITGGGTLAINGSQDVNNGFLDKISIGHLSGSYGWIQTWNATALYLNKVGNAVYAGTQRIDNNSDARIKNNVQKIENALNVVLSLNGKKYNMLDEDNILRYGFIAQEVEPYLKDFVTHSDRKFEKGNLKIENLLTLENSGSAWAALLVEAIKELNQKITNLEAQIKQ
jgi:hypothetical protein